MTDNGSKLDYESLKQLKTIVDELNERKNYTEEQLKKLEQECYELHTKCSESITNERQSINE